MQIPAKTYFATAQELHTPEYLEYVIWSSHVWELNHLKNSVKPES